MEVMRRGFVTVISLLFLLNSTAAYNQQGATQKIEKLMPGKTIEMVLKEHTNDLMSLPGVVGTAQGLCSGKPCVKVYVVKKTSDLVKQIPATLDGYAVEIQETGEIRALDRK